MSLPKLTLACCRRLAPRGLVAILAVSLALVVAASAGAGTRVRFQTVLGNIDVELLDDLRPVSVENFLNYVNDGDYTDSIVHRSVAGFVIQGGGFVLSGDPQFPLDEIPTDPPFQDIPGPSNLRGTLAMAENDLGATSQWFINLSDNTGLDPDFTVFGEVVAGMHVVDAIAALPTFPFGGAFGEIPLRDYDEFPAIPADEHFVVIHTVPEPDAALQLLGAGGLLALLARRRCQAQ